MSIKKLRVKMKGGNQVLVRVADELIEQYMLHDNETLEKTTGLVTKTDSTGFQMIVGEVKMKPSLYSACIGEVMAIGSNAWDRADSKDDPRAEVGDIVLFQRNQGDKIESFIVGDEEPNTMYFFLPGHAIYATLEK